MSTYLRCSSCGQEWRIPQGYGHRRVDACSSCQKKYDHQLLAGAPLESREKVKAFIKRTGKLRYTSDRP